MRVCWRRAPRRMRVAVPDESELVVALAPHLDAFVAALFGIEAETLALARATACARSDPCLQAAVRAAPGGEEVPRSVGLRRRRRCARDLEARFGETLTERAFADHVAAWETAGDAAALDVALRYAAWATLTEAGRAAHPGNTLFRVPHRLDYQHLVPVETIERDGVTMLRLPEHHWRPRDGFALTDAGMNPQQALDQINYCIWCHTQGKDSCRHGLKDRKTGAFQKSPFGVTLAGCPLDEKISEMHTLRAQGSAIGAFAIIAIDNPMMAATGHRICNDCMKACIYQRQDPVDIPQAETRRAEGRARPALGLRDLRAADAVESARHPSPAAASGQRAQGADRRARSRRLHAGASPDERRPHRGGDRRTEDRAARLRSVGSGARRRAVVREPRRPRDGRLRRRGRIRHHRAVEQELPEAGAPAAGAASAVRAFRRHPLRRRRHARHGRCLGDGVRPHRAVHGGGQADRARHPEWPGARRAGGVGLPDGAATHRRGKAVIHHQSASCACRWW